MSSKTPKDSGPNFLVEFKPDDHVGIISINRPSKMNALTFEMFLEMEKVFDDLCNDPTKDLRAIVLTSTSQHFTAGLDLQSAMKIG